MWCLVAASTVASMPSVPLELWEPVSDPLRFVAEARRANQISQVAQESGGDRVHWQEELRQNGVLALLGYDVYPPLIDSLADADLQEIIGSEPRPVFIARFRATKDASDPLASKLIDRGLLVEHGNFELSESWWFHSERLAEDGDQLLGATATWLADALLAAR